MSTSGAAAFQPSSVLSPPLLATLDSEHTFGGYDGSPLSRTSTEPGSRQEDGVNNVSSTATSRSHRRTRSRASSIASVPDHAAPAPNRQAHHHNHNHSQSSRRHRRLGSSGDGDPRSSYRSTTARSRMTTIPPRSSDVAPSEDPSALNSAMRNRSTPHLESLSRLASSYDHGYGFSPLTTLTAPSSPLLATAASMALAMSPTSQAAAMADHRMPTEFNLDSSAPTSPRIDLSRNPSGYFDPATIAPLPHDPTSHAQLRSSLSAVLPSSASSTLPSDRATDHRAAVRSASQTEWAQHAVHLQQAANLHLLGLHRLFASRSTPHLPDLDSPYLGHDFDSPPPYAPRASALETELERADNGQGSQWSQHTTSNLNGTEPPLPPPITIPILSGNGNARIDSQPASATVPAAAAATAGGLQASRPHLRPRSLSRGSRSGPPSPSASFYGRRGLTSLSPLPAGLGMTPAAASYTSHVSAAAVSRPASPDGFAPDSDRDDDQDGVLSFSSSRSKQRRDERQHPVNTLDIIGGSSISPAASTSASFSNAAPPNGDPSPCSTSLPRRMRSGSTGSVRQHLRPRTPISAAPLPITADAAHRTPSREDPDVISSTSLPRPPKVPSPVHQNGQGALAEASTQSPDADAEVSEPASPTSDSTHVPAEGSIDEAEEVEYAARTSVDQNEEDDNEDEDFPLMLKLLLHSLRILAAVPGCIGTFWLARNTLLLVRVNGSLLSAGHSFIASDGTVYFPGDKSQLVGQDLGQIRLGRRQAGSLDFAVSCLWSMGTAYHALSFTTLLLRRWLLYYSILPSLIRLVALQAICWPLVRLTVFLFGPDQPLGAWAVIGTTTALSDIISRWVTSNIADAPLEGEVDEEEEEQEEEEEAAMEYLSDAPFGMYDRTRVSARGSGRFLYGNRRDYGMGGNRGGAGIGVGIETDWDVRSGDESEATLAAAAKVYFQQERARQRKQRRGGQGTRFWRAVIGGPSTPSKRRRQNQGQPDGNWGGNDLASSRGSPSAQRRFYLSAPATDTEMEGESDWPGYGTDRTLNAGTADGLRRRLNGRSMPRGRLFSEGEEEGNTAASGMETDATTTAAAVSRARKEAISRAFKTVLPHSSVPPFLRGASSARQPSTSSLLMIQRGGSRRKFHWDVAMRRNVLPIAALGYLSMWILILDAMRIGS